MRYTTRLYLGFGSVILMIILLTALIVSMLSKQSDEMTNVVEDRYEKIKLLNNTRVNLKNIDQHLNVYINSENSDQTTNYIQNIQESTMTIDENLNILHQIIELEDAKMELSNLYSQIGAYKTTVEQILSLMTLEDVEKAIFINENATEQFDLLVNTCDSLISIQENVMEDTIITSKSSADLYTNISLASIIFVVLIGFGISQSVIRNIQNRFVKIKDVMNSIQYGSESLPRLKILADDEIGEIARAYNEMANALEEHEKNERQYLEEMEDQNWLSKKLTELSLLSQEVLDFNVLGDKYLQELLPMVEASFGALYITKDDVKAPYLVKVAAYADSVKGRAELGEETIALGEGLVGQCAKDGKPIQLSNIPSDYVSISSSLGKASPNSILILPIILDDTVMAVLEIASLERIDELYEKLLLQSTEQLAITIYRIKQQMHVRELLEEAQTLNEELQTQSEELQLQQEELRTMNEELEAQYKHSEQKTKDLELTKYELEERTRQVQLSSKYKSEFLANMSHELRTPLNSLLILAQILQENKEQNLTDNQREYASTIYAAGKDLLNLINDILDLAKIESGKMDIQLGEMNIREILHFSKKQFEPLAAQKGINFSLKVDDDVPTFIEADEQKVFQILKNLLSNAIKFTENGSVEVCVHRQFLAEKKAEFLAFVVEDTGIGIAAENRHIIFEAFQQADGTTSRKYGGTGLGLSICRELASLLNGFITVESMEGEGSRFTLYLPLTATQGKLPIQEVAVSEEKVKKREGMELESHVNTNFEGELTGKKVLVVDDDMRNIFSLTTALEAVGMKVLFAENGREGLEVLENNRDIDIVLMDIMMPEMDGYEAMRRIRENKEFHGLPIVALTAKAMSHDRKKCMEAGASDYITKPVKLEQLFSILAVWLHK